MKRLFDFSVALVAIILFLPLMIFTTIMVAVFIGFPVVFVQKRPGFKEKPFHVFKYRTMTNAVDENGELLPDEQRLVPVGKLIRSLSLDELPQLFNVLKGDLSLVGPRPLLMEYLPRYNEKHRRRHDVRPGITGWAQVNGRNTISWQENLI